MDAIDYGAEGIVFNIQRFSIHDGPGVRTIVFLKGCPLSCKWCSNPESQSRHPVVMYEPSSCLHCGKCMDVCTRGAINPANPYWIDRDKCGNCGKCAAACPAGALVLKGKSLTVEDVIRQLQKDETVFRRSGGGVTLSGGEPLMQAKFSSEILKACHAHGWHTAVETTGYGSESDIRMMFPHLDLVLMDIKSYDRDRHIQNTGVSNEVILKNAELISRITQTVIRVPVIPGFNNTDREISDICKFVKILHNIQTIHLLPYHTYGENKYALLGRQYGMPEIKSPSEEEMQHLKELVEQQNFRCVIGG